MPKKGGKKQGTSNLGKSLIKQKNKQQISRHHVQDGVDNPNDRLKSIIDQNSLKDFLMEAELSAKNFEAARGIRFKDDKKIIDMNAVMGLKPKVELDVNKLKLKVPRRPKWNKQMTGDELKQLENDSFLNWRRELAHIEEQLLLDKVMTPFEKNIEVWRQLWRVVEKADIIVQIVDGRNPLFFRCSDLDVYVSEVSSDKQNILLINKSDLLSDPIRQVWSDHFNNKGIKHIFFSAKLEQDKIDATPHETQQTSQSGFIPLPENPKKDDNENAGTNAYQPKPNTSDIFTRNSLISVLKKMISNVHDQQKNNNEDNQENDDEDETQEILEGMAEKKPRIKTIGMVGYPNVGKSSVINVLCNKKRVTVGALPGKTKHFQTLFIEKDVMLCDCPGLVFPNFTSTRAEMVCNGVLPIDTLKDWIGPMSYLALRIPKQVFETIYKYHIEYSNPTASQILAAYSKHRGFMSGSGLPDEARGAKIILKDLVQGKLLFANVPPDYDKEKYGKIIQYNTDLNIEDKIEAANPTVTKQINEDGEEEKVDTIMANKDEVTENDDKDEEFYEDKEVQKGKEDLDDEFFEDEKPVLLIDELDNEDVLMILLDGKSIDGYKLTKQQRRDIKFRLKAGEKVDIKAMIRGKPKKKTGASSLGKFAQENYVKPDHTFTAAK